MSEIDTQDKDKSAADAAYAAALLKLAAGLIRLIRNGNGGYSDDVHGSIIEYINVYIANDCKYHLSQHKMKEMLEHNFYPHGKSEIMDIEEYERYMAGGELIDGVLRLVASSLVSPSSIQFNKGINDIEDVCRRASGKHTFPLIWKYAYLDRMNRG